MTYNMKKKGIYGLMLAALAFLNIACGDKKEKEFALIGSHWHSTWEITAAGQKIGTMETDYYFLNDSTIHEVAETVISGTAKQGENTHIYAFDDEVHGHLWYKSDRSTTPWTMTLNKEEKELIVDPHYGENEIFYFHLVE